jgi:hypothetical protein
MRALLSKRRIKATLLNGPGVALAAIGLLLPRIREFLAARRPPWVHRRADCSAEPPGAAALGAIGGAIGGNAGKGAAIGAGTGAVFGGMRRRRWAEREEFQQTSYLEQQQSALNQGRGNFNQAFGVCMTGRGYTVG